MRTSLRESAVVFGERRQGKFYAVEIGSATIGYFDNVLYLLPAQGGSKDQRSKNRTSDLKINSIGSS